MTTLKEVIKADLDIFMSMDEFAEAHIINGQRVICVLHGLSTSDVITKQGGNKVEYDSIHGETLVLHIMTSDLPDRVVSSNVISMDDNIYRIASTSEDLGITTLTLEVDRM